MSSSSLVISTINRPHPVEPSTGLQNDQETKQQGSSENSGDIDSFEPDFGLFDN
jgi:hypothetical protein